MGGPERAIEQLNATNAKRVALGLVAALTLGHGLLHVRYGPDSCSWLLAAGRYKGDREWQPYGCMLHGYTRTDARHCFRYLAFWGRTSRLVFVGDERVRQLYDAFVAQIRLDDDESDRARVAGAPPPRADASYADAKLRLYADFVWSPDVSDRMTDRFAEWRRSAHPPDTIVAGCGARNATAASARALREYRENLTRLVQPIDALAARRTSVLWMPQGPSPLAGANAQIDLYNGAAAEMLTHSAAKLWLSSRLVTAGALARDGDDDDGGGLRLSDTALRHDTQILLNMYCNDHMNFNDGTCCSSPEPHTALQVVAFSSFFVCMLITVVLTAYRLIDKCKRGRAYSPLPTNANSNNNNDNSNNNSSSPSEPTVYDTFVAISKLGLIVCYFYLCDRTNFFMKENKYYSEWSFWLPVGYVLVLGLFFTEDARSPKVLHRDQTLEWRGWMQLLVLAAQSTGAARLLPIHMLVRALNSAYLFLTGYGHFHHAWHTGDTGLVRLLRVLFRLNLMTVVLCLTMNRPYQFYHFVPLASFWFAVLFVALALPPRVTAHGSDGHPYRYSYLALKFVALFVVITVLYVSEVFFEKVFVTRPWKALFVTTDDDIRQWWRHWSRDRYSTACGAAFAACLALAQRHGLVDDGAHGNLWSARGAVGAALGALVALLGWLALPFLCGGEQECDEIHGYACAIPIVCYVVLRNVSGALRSRVSSLLAWFGDISLELFVCQHHIWLAADTHGVLVLVPDAPILNLMLTSFVFVCVAHEVRRLTLILLPTAVPADLKRCLRNVFIFVLILIPIGVRDGMF